MSASLQKLQFPKWRDGPIADIGKPSDHFIGCRLKGQGHGQAERLRGLEVEFVPVSLFLYGDGLGQCYCL